MLYNEGEGMKEHKQDRNEDEVVGGGGRKGQKDKKINKNEALW